MIRLTLSLVLLLALPASLNTRTFAEEGFQELFNGENLDGWDGDPRFWSVEDGTITGVNEPGKRPEGNTFLIWKGGTVDDFELRLQYRIVGGNSGIQYRSKEIDRWVISGYQGDFEAGDTYSGILYEERGRGILALRGQKVIIQPDGEKYVVGSLGNSEEIQAGIKKEDWNDYLIRAQGNNLTHVINGRVTVDVVDHQADRRVGSGLLALQLHIVPEDQSMKVQFRNIRLQKLAPAEAVAAKRKKVVFIAGRPSHGYGQHEHNAGCLLLAHSLRRAMPEIDIDVLTNGWPADETLLADADSVVMYCDGGGGHFVIPHLDDFQKLVDKGVGVVCIHYAVEVPKGEPGDKFLDWIGGYFETDWSVNPHWTANFTSLPAHEITRGVQPFEINDEWYYHMRFRDGMKGVTPILTAVPPASTLDRPDGPHSGNPHVRAEKGQPQHVAWAYERPGGGRGFGWTGGHFHWNWGDDNFRRLMLNAICWTAHVAVPENGVEDEPVSRRQLEANQDEPKPREGS